MSGRKKITMENKLFFTLGLSIFLLSLVYFIIPTFYVPTVDIINWLGIISYLVSGLLFLIGNYKLCYRLDLRYRLITFSGFGLGLFAWSHLIIGNIYSILWYPTQFILIYHEFSIIGYYISFIHLILTISGRLLAIIVIMKMREITQKVKQKLNYPIFQDLIKDQKPVYEYKRITPTKKIIKKIIFFDLIYLVAVITFIVCIFALLNDSSIYLEPDYPMYPMYILLIINLIIINLHDLGKFWSEIESPKIVELPEILKEIARKELMNLQIFPEGEILTIIDNIAYSDPEYVKKTWRKRPWREKGILVLTSKELIFVGKKSNFLILLSEINFIHSFIATWSKKTCKLCEINYNSQKIQVILMGVIGIFYSREPTSELESKSMKLMEYLQNWYNSIITD